MGRTAKPIGHTAEDVLLAAIRLLRSLTMADEDGHACRRVAQTVAWTDLIDVTARLAEIHALTEGEILSCVLQ